MNADDRDLLLAAADRALRDGWRPWELAEVIHAEARRLGIAVPAATLRQIMNRYWTTDGSGTL